MTERRFTTAEKNACRQAVSAEIRAGRMVRPETCSKCGRRGFGKRATIHAHHPSYAHPLLVEWLCHGCHHIAHRGEPRTFKPVTDEVRAERRARARARAAAREAAFFDKHSSHLLVRWIRANGHTLASAAQHIGRGIQTLRGVIAGSSNSHVDTLSDVYRATGVLCIASAQRPTQSHPYEQNGETWA